MQDRSSHVLTAYDRLFGFPLQLVAEPAKLLQAGWQPPVETRAGLAALLRREPMVGGAQPRS